MQKGESRNGTNEPQVAPKKKGKPHVDHHRGSAAAPGSRRRAAGSTSSRGVRAKPAAPADRFAVWPMEAFIVNIADTKWGTVSQMVIQSRSMSGGGPELEKLKPGCGTASWIS